MKKSQKLMAIAAVLLISVTSGVAMANEQGKARYASSGCVGCHGANGISAVPTYPNVAGQKPAYVVKQLQAFKAGTRIDPTMKAMTAALSEQDMADLAGYISTL